MRRLEAVESGGKNNIEIGSEGSEVDKTRSQAVKKKMEDSKKKFHLKQKK